MLPEVNAGRKQSCCDKITLETLAKNEAAIAAYKKFTFSEYRLDQATDKALFSQKRCKMP